MVIRYEHNHSVIGISQTAADGAQSSMMHVDVEPSAQRVVPGTNGGTTLIIASIVSVQFGAAVAKQLFADVGPAGVVLLRQGIAAIVLVAAVRPRIRGRDAGDWMVVVAFGAVLAAMNLTFYEAVARLPLGMAVTIELLGPLGLAVALSRRRQEFAWCAVACAGVLLLGEGGSSIDSIGIMFAVTAAVCWAGYILLVGAAGRRFVGLDGLALAMVAASLMSSPFGLQAGRSLVAPRALALGALVAVLSAIVPFSLEVTARRRVAPGVFGVLMSLSPAVAAASGLIVLHQHLTVPQLAGMAMVVMASAATIVSARRRGRRARAG
jgi:inner membrane transporter RhtA